MGPTIAPPDVPSDTQEQADRTLGHLGKPCSHRRNTSERRTMYGRLPLSPEEPAVLWFPRMVANAALVPSGQPAANQLPASVSSPAGMLGLRGTRC